VGSITLIENRQPPQIGGGGLSPRKAALAIDGGAS